MSQNKRAVIYCRVSTKEQVEEGNSLATQEKICKEYALKNGYEVAELFIEQGESAKTQDRTELRRLLAYCSNKKNAINAVIAYKIDRISRNTDDYSQIRIVLKRYNVEIKSTSEYFENTPAGHFMENIIANVAQFDNDVRTERCIGGMKEAVREGRYVWTAPLGYSNVRVGGKATITPNEMASYILKAFEMVAKCEGTIQEIRRQLTKEGLVTPKGKPCSQSQFYNIFSNELYTGWMMKFGERHKGLFTSIISVDLFEHVQRVLKRRTKASYEYKINNPDFPLRKFVTHPSGLKLTGAWSQGRNKKYPYYRFMLKGFEYKRDSLEDQFKQFMNQFTFNDDLFMRLRHFIRERLSKSFHDRNHEAELLQGLLKELAEKERKLTEKHIEGVYSDRVAKEQLAFIDEEVHKTTTALFKLPARKVNFEEMLVFVRTFLKSPSAVWNQISFISKLKLQWFIFPSGVTFDGKKFRTKEICSIFKSKDIFLTLDSYQVHSDFKSSNNPKIPNQIFCEKIGDEICSLAEILKGEDDKPP